MHNRNSRKKDLARRVFVYTVMTTSVIVVVISLSFSMLGYRFNSKNHSIEQTGLVQYRSTPRGAMVSIDGKDIDTAPTKNTVLPGQHQFSMKLKGYENWNKTITIRSDTVTQLDYAKLVPAERKIKPMRDLTGLESVKFSPDGKYFAGVGTDKDGVLATFWGDLRSPDNLRISEQPIDKSLLNGYEPENKDAQHSFVVDKWTGNSRFVIVKHNYKINDQPTQTQWLRLDRDNPKEILDISKGVGFAMREIYFKGSNGNELYVLQDDGSVRNVSLNDLTISRPLLTGVKKFTLYDTDIIAFVADRSDTRVAGIWRDDWKEEQIIRKLTANEKGQQFDIQVSEYFDKDTAVVSVGDTATIYRGTLPGSETAMAAFLQTAKEVSLGRPIEKISISGSGRFILLSDKTGFISYDLERESLSTEIALRGDSKLEWFDSYHIWHVDESGQVLMQDFDGANAYKLLPATAGYDATFSGDGKFVYAFVKEKDKLQLQRLAMTVQ